MKGFVWPLGRVFTRKARIAGVQALVRAANEGDYSDIAQILDKDFVFADALGHELKGRDEFVKSHKDFRVVGENPQIRIDEMHVHGNEVLARGVLETPLSEETQPTLWAFRFKDDLIDRVDVTRDGDQLTLPQYYSIAHSRDHIATH